MLSPKTKRNVFRIIPFGVIWLIFGLTYTILEKGLLGNLAYYPTTGNPYDSGENTFIFLFLATFSGLVVGSFEIFYLNKLFSKKSFGIKLLYKSMIYLAIIFLFLLISTVIMNSYILQVSAFDKQVWTNMRSFLENFVFLSVIIYLTLVIVVSLFFSEVSENLGLLVLHNFLIGKYHKPIEEERIFMFLDMKSSTTIAEKLGHVKYFQMLREYYSDFSDPIIQYAGEIYQYVGDEIIISWKLNSGQQNNNCLKCFFAMKESILNQSDKYMSKYGLVPTFKAGLHLGKVTTGEIGEIKKDIMFTGDVLNTAARIQGLCDTYNVEIILSDQLKNMLKPGTEFQSKSLGISELRGRKENVELFTIVKE